MIMLADNVICLNWEDSLLYHCYVLHCVTKLLMCECMSFPRGSNKVILTSKTDFGYYY